VLQTGLEAANLIGDGFYGVDLKERDGKAVVIEINDNPNLDAGEEDAAEGDEVYRKILGFFLERLERSKRGEGS
jgi:glutathione synthase/RimK-type ligase-like ATP-grasp enzyme